MFEPMARALSQLDDPVFLRVIAWSVLLALICFAGLGAAAVWMVGHTLALHGILGWLAEWFGAAGVVLLAMWLFLPVAAVIGTLFFDRVAAAVETRFYPGLDAPDPAPLASQLWDAAALGLRILGLNVAALALGLALPGIGLAIGWAIAAYAIGRGLFVAVAMRRMGRGQAAALYRANRGIVLAQGGLLALAAYVPLANLLIPVIGVAAMVHALDRSLYPTAVPRPV